MPCCRRSTSSQSSLEEELIAEEKVTSRHTMCSRARNSTRQSSIIETQRDNLHRHAVRQKVCYINTGSKKNTTKAPKNIITTIYMSTTALCWSQLSDKLWIVPTDPMFTLLISWLQPFIHFVKDDGQSPSSTDHKVWHTLHDGVHICTCTCTQKSVGVIMYVKFSNNHTWEILLFCWVGSMSCWRGLSWPVGGMSSWVGGELCSAIGTSCWMLSISPV